MAVDEEKKKAPKEGKQTKQKENKQRVNNGAKSNVKNTKAPVSEVKTFFENAGLKVVDERGEGGYLWVEGDREKIGKYIDEAVDRYQISGRYATGKTLRSRPGWYTNTKK